MLRSTRFLYVALVGEQEEFIKVALDSKAITLYLFDVAHPLLVVIPFSLRLYVQAAYYFVVPIRRNPCVNSASGDTGYALSRHSWIDDHDHDQD